MKIIRVRFGKYELCFFNVMNWLLGIVFIAVGIAILIEWKIDIDIFYAIPWGFIVTGAVMFIISIIAYCGIVNDSYRMVITYAAFLIMIAIMQVALVVSMFMHDEAINARISTAVVMPFQKRFNHKEHKSVITYINNMQQQFQCCGIHTQKLLLWPLPPSCCDQKDVVEGFCGTSYIYPGCLEVVLKKYKNWRTSIIAVVASLLGFEIIGVLFAVSYAESLIKRRQRQTEQIEGRRSLLKRTLMT